MMVDSHCHLADAAFADDLDATVARAREAGLVEALCILSADEPDEVARHAVVRDAWSDVRFAAGIHPHRAGAYADRTAEVRALTAAALDEVQAVALGEIGLDYHYDFAPRDVQQAVFAEQVRLAVERDLPVVIHTREAFEDTAAVLREAGNGRVRGVMHCFTGTLDEARVSLDLGFFVSIAGIVTFPRGANLREIAGFVPEDRLLVETDAPFLAPVPYRGKRNEPAWVARTLDAVAQVRATPVDALGTATTHNFHRLVGPPEGGPR